MVGRWDGTPLKTPSGSEPSTGVANVQPVASDPARCAPPQAKEQEHDCSRRKPDPEDKGGEKFQNTDEGIEALGGTAKRFLEEAATQEPGQMDGLRERMLRRFYAATVKWGKHHGAPRDPPGFPATEDPQ
ncbi:hypothetical protein IscW_ISCW008734 [Ixodes scapularis]|uniref:Uncharacterized protein n=1 Tax=Ixodes scapularis TaxID=6945 RepID=B7Q1X1_IXOSC|nr:hypothetical protein IscW_ISCW008734 [Ixodes scapularis]|eukprot:XP_002410205.1 hypothetical protein IscW_ISCW008734 [Ixodes scapularis]